LILSEAAGESGSEAGHGEWEKMAFHAYWVLDDVVKRRDSNTVHSSRPPEITGSVPTWTRCYYEADQDPGSSGTGRAS
jgi:hypothetical protein